MLVLSRKAGEKIFIGDNIAVTVLSIQNGQVKLGFDAPLDIKILRDNIKNKLSEDNIKFPIDQLVNDNNYYNNR
jgi:carbon storage regulator